MNLTPSFKNSPPLRWQLTRIGTGPNISASALRVAVLLAVLLWHPGFVLAQPAQPSTDSTTIDTDTTPAPASPSDPRTVANSRRLETLLNQQETAKARATALETDNQTWQQNFQQLQSQGLTEEPPYAFLVVDQAEDELVAERQHAEDLEDAIQATEAAVDRAKNDLDTKQRQLRLAKERLTQASTTGEEVERQATLDTATTAELTATALVELRHLELANLQAELKVHLLEITFLEKKAELYKASTRFEQSELDTVHADLKNRAANLTVALHQAETDQAYFDEQWRIAHNNLETLKASGQLEGVAALDAQIQAHEIARQTKILEVYIISRQQARLEALQQVWDQRFQLASAGITAEQEAEWEAQTADAVVDLRSEARRLNDMSEQVREELATLQRKLHNIDDSQPGVLRWHTTMQSLLNERIALFQSDLLQIETTRRVYDKLYEDIAGKDFGIGYWIAKAKLWIKWVWDYELWTIDQLGITVGQIIRGIILLIIGVFASRLISYVIGRRLFTRMGVDTSAAAALQSVAFYTLVLMFTLIVLKSVNVPLTAFSVLGGALAIGVGIGSQHIVNNFISGLVLLAERPVRVGDLIQLEDLYGNVEHIGARSTRVRTGENLEILVPNSTFLETNVVNWTLSDNHMRLLVKFGVIYGSPTGKVSHLALKAAHNHRRVFDNPTPFVIFADFGDHSLNFELHFWVAVRTLIERRKIESDIRFNLDLLFREANIVIAFPQQDTHLYTSKPIRVELAQPSPGGDQPPQPPADSNIAS